MFFWLCFSLEPYLRGFNILGQPQPAKHSVIHSDGQTRKGASAHCVFGGSRTQYKLFRFLALKLVCNLTEGIPVKYLFFLNKPMFVLLVSCIWLWCGLRSRGGGRKGTVPFLLLCYSTMSNQEESGIPYGLMTYKLQNKQGC